MRYMYVFNNLKSLSRKLHDAVSVEDLTEFSNVLENHCPTFMSQSGDTREIRSKEFLMYLSPPVSTCDHCGKKLSIRNNQSSAVLFTLHGPVHCVRVSLDCRDCSIHYGVCKYSDKNGARFYTQSNIDFI